MSEDKHVYYDGDLVGQTNTANALQLRNREACVSTSSIDFVMSHRMCITRVSMCFCGKGYACVFEQTYSSSVQCELRGRAKLKHSNVSIKLKSNIMAVELFLGFSSQREFTRH